MVAHCSVGANAARLTAGESRRSRGPVLLYGGATHGGTGPSGSSPGLVVWVSSLIKRLLSVLFVPLLVFQLDYEYH